MIDLIELVYGSTIIASLIGLHTLFLLARAQISIIIKVAYPILYTICIILAIHTFVNIRGYALPEPPKGEFDYVHYEQAGDIIVLWVYEKNTKKDRLHHIPNTEQNREKLEQAKEAKEKGKKVTLEVKKTNGDNDMDYDVQEVDTADVEKTDPKSFKPFNHRNNRY